MFEIEAHNMVICTCTISDEDEERIRQYILNNPEKFQYKSDEEAIIEAIGDLEINLYDQYVESDSYTDNVVWSTFEERRAEEILNR